MKTVRQAKIWATKVPYFSEGSIEEIAVKTWDTGLEIERPILAVVVDNLALHLSIGFRGELMDRSFTVTHVPSGRFLFDRKDPEYIADLDMEFWAAKADEFWARQQPQT